MPEGADGPAVIVAVLAVAAGVALVILCADAFRANQQRSQDAQTINQGFSLLRCDSAWVPHSI